MDDVIRRQDAIDIVNKYNKSHMILKGKPMLGAASIVIELKDLPSTQRWIPCSERLPFSEYGESESVICCLDDGTQEILYFNGSNWCYPTGESYPFQEYKTYAIAWMPLPEPYEEKQDEK